MEYKNITKLNMIQDVNAIYLEDNGRIIEFIGDDIKYFIKDDTVTYINIYYSNTSIKQDIDKLLNLKYDSIKKNYGITEIFLQREIYNNTNVYNVYSIAFNDDNDILSFRLIDKDAYTD